MGSLGAPLGASLVEHCAPLWVASTLWVSVSEEDSSSILRFHSTEQVDGGMVHQGGSRWSPTSKVDPRRGAPKMCPCGGSSKLGSRRVVRIPKVSRTST